MIDWDVFADLLARYARRDRVEPGDVMFGDGLDLSSIRYTEFILDLEETHGIDIDMGRFGPEVRTAGQLFSAIRAQAGG